LLRQCFSEEWKGLNNTRRIINDMKKKQARGLNKEEILEKIEETKDLIKKKGVKKIGIFGSFVKNNQDKKSDVDILIEFDKPTLEKYLYVLRLLEKKLKRKIDLVIESDLKPELVYVKKEAQYVKI